MADNDDQQTPPPAKKTARKRTAAGKKAARKTATAGKAAKKAAGKRAATKGGAKKAAPRKQAARKASAERAGERTYDFVLLGATGYTGGLTAAYLAASAPAGARWAIAGRDRGRLEAVRADLARHHSAAAAPGIIEADIGDAESMRALAASTRVLATTVGPYVRYGEPVVAACALSGTHYLDLTGEPEFVDTMWLRYHDMALDSGAKLIHCCGFDSIPHDLGALFTAQQLPEEAPKRIDGFVRAGGTFSAGTYHSALLAFSRLRQARAAHRERRGREPVTSARRVGGGSARPHFDKRLDTWVLPFPSVDPQIVMRSARALSVFGPSFRYGHYIQVRTLRNVLMLAGGAGALLAGAQVPPLRRWLMARKSSGEGPSDAQRERGWFRVRFFGEGGGRSVIVDVTGGDPGYGETARMLGESVLCTAFDALPDRAGQLTPAVAMGDALRRRLDAIGIRFSVVESR